MDMTKTLLLNNESNTFEDLFFGSHYNMTVREVATLLDTSERYVCDYIKNHFDYISVTKKQTNIFLPENLLYTGNSHRKVMDKALLILNAGKDINNNTIVTQSVGDYYDSLVRKRLFINRQSFRRYLLRYLRVVVVNPTTADVEFKNIQKWQVDHLLKGTAKLYSMATLREKWMYKHNMQVYRRIQCNEDIIKVALVSNSTENPIVRYLINV